MTIVDDHRELLHVGHHLLDHQLLDTRGERCGKVDDVALHTRDGVTEIEALLTGPGALRSRYPGRVLRWIIGLAGQGETIVPARAVGAVDDHVHLTATAPSLGLAGGEARAGEVLARVLGPDVHAARLGRARGDETVLGDTELQGDLRVADVLGHDLYGPDGALLGTAHDLRFARTGRVLGEAAGAAWVLTHVLVGRRGLAERFGVRIGDSGAVPVATLRRDGGSIIAFPR